MTTFHQSSFSKRIFHCARIAAALTMSAAITACSSVGTFFRTKNSVLPVETIDSSGGKLSPPHAYESFDRLYVSGSLQKSFGRHLPCAAHVDVQLIDNKGRMVAEKHDDIDPTHPFSAGNISGRTGFVTSFPASEARKAAKIVVRYHMDGHAGNL